MCGSPITFSPGSSSNTHTRSGAQTIVGRPAPNVYSTRPSLPGAGTCFSVIQVWLTLSASRAVCEGVVSMLDKFPGICYNRLWPYCLLGGRKHGKDGD